MKKKQRIVLSLLALALSTPAFAENYIGATLGSSHIDIDCGGLPQCDNSDTGYKLYGGFALPGSSLQGLSLEVAYIDFGSARAALSPVYSRTIDVSAVTFGAALRAKFTPSLTGVGRLGLAYVDAKASGAVGPFAAGSSSSSDLKLHGGLGLEFAINKQLKLVGAADFTSYDTGNESGSVHLLSIGAQYGF